MDKEDEKEKMITKCFEVEKPMDRGKCLIADQRQLRPKLAGISVESWLLPQIPERLRCYRDQVPLKTVGSEMGLNKEIRQQFIKNFVHLCS